MDPIETKCIEIFQLIDWKSIGKGEDYDTYHLLIVEFWRRAAKFAEFRKLTGDLSPWDIVQAAFPMLHNSDELKDICTKFVESAPSSSRHKFFFALTNYVLFNKARAQGLISEHERNIYSPIVKLCQLKGAFYLHHGMMELDDLRQISSGRHEWKQYADRDVIVDIDDDFNILWRRS